MEDGMTVARSGGQEQNDTLQVALIQITKS